MVDVVDDGDDSDDSSGDDIGDGDDDGDNGPGDVAGMRCDGELREGFPDFWSRHPRASQALRAIA